jgi:hypothetical protein
MGKMEASWDLVRRSLILLASDKELVLLPLTSGLISLLTLAMLSGWYAAAYWPELRALPPHGSAADLPHRGFLYVLLFLFYLISYFAVTFCNVALVAVANNRMGGGSWRMHQGLALAWQRRFTILQWAILAATVGIVLQMISERVGFLGKFFIRLVGLAWGLATFFIVPVLAFDDLSPIEAVRRSAQLFRKTWGENVAAGVSSTLIFMIPLTLGIGLWFAAQTSLSLSPAGMMATGALLVVYIMAISAVMSATTSIYTVALYNYALGGRVHGGFSEEQFLSTWVPKD